jgi:hypothetical protein
MNKDAISNIEVISRVVVVPVFALYIMGFIVVNSYTSRFGIVSFDVINTRYIFAGVIPSVFIISSFFNANYIMKGIVTDGVLKMGVMSRVVFYIKVMLYMSISSMLLNIIFVSYSFINTYKKTDWRSVGDFGGSVPLLKYIINIFNNIPGDIGRLPKTCFFNVCYCIFIICCVICNKFCL